MNFVAKNEQRFSLYRWLMSKRIKSSDTNSGEPYELQTFIGDQMVSSMRVPDPFIHTRLTVGWYHLLVALIFRRHLEIRVTINADPITVDYVLDADPDHLSPARYKVFNACLNDALGAVGETE